MEINARGHFNVVIPLSKFRRLFICCCTGKTPSFINVYIKVAKNIKDPIPGINPLKIFVVVDEISIVNIEYIADIAVIKIEMKEMKSATLLLISR